MTDDLIQKTAQHARNILEGESSGHDWWHVYRVWKLAMHIAEKEGADMRIVELTALLHDIGDHKFHGGDTTVGPRMAREWLESQGVDEDTIKHVCEIIAHMSYKGANVPDKMESIEGKIVQDADRLEAIGAIGIARTFAYGGSRNRSMHEPEIAPVLHNTPEAYHSAKGTTINHFYEKLLLLKDRMNTETGKSMAQGRHEFIEAFLKRFFDEWEGNA